MEYSSKILSPSIMLYGNSVDFTNDIINLSVMDKENWKIQNVDALEWNNNRVLGYDEYPVQFNFASHEKFLILAKRVFDYANDYAKKNILPEIAFDSCTIRKYSKESSFLEQESADMENSCRKITSILFLNDVAEGGEVTFKNFDLSLSPKSGDIVFFPSSFAYSFKINRPKSEENFIVISHFM